MLCNQLAPRPAQTLPCCSELVHYRGEPDPFKGDVPNARVREFAKEVLEALFNANPVTTSTAAASRALPTPTRYSAP